MTEEEIENTATVFKALAHPIRIGILMQLQEDSKNSNELYKALGCSQSVMSQQIKILKECGLISCQMNGTSKYCKIISPHLHLLLMCAQETLKEINPCKSKETSSC